MKVPYVPGTLDIKLQDVCIMHNKLYQWRRNGEGGGGLEFLVHKLRDIVHAFERERNDNFMSYHLQSLGCGIFTILGTLGRVS